MTEPSEPLDQTAAAAIDRLNRKLIALSHDPDNTAEMERTAKALTATIRSLEQADAFLSQQPGRIRAGQLLSDAEVDAVLDRMQRMVDNGLLEPRR